VDHLVFGKLIDGIDERKVKTLRLPDSTVPREYCPKLTLTSCC